jgi:diguanylate cyclase (GGDEF)-like protein
VALLLPIQVLDAFLDQQVQLMLTAGPFVLLTLLLLIIVSRKLETSLNHLADGTTELLRNLHQGGQPDIPKSGILEVDALAENFLFMNRTLEDLFGELQTVNDDLVIQSEQLRKSESELFRLAHFDVLTQLPNRQYLRVQAFRIQEELSRQQDSGRFSLLLVDLDKFKPINDRYGHAVGDMLLQEVGQVFRHVVGDEVDTGDFSARLGGDEFVSVLRHKTREQVRAIADALIKALSTPFKVAGVEATIACSVGVSHYPEDGQEFSVLLRRADLAMYQAKARGGNCWAEYTMPVGQRDGGDPDEKKELDAGDEAGIQGDWDENAGGAE